MERRFYVRRHGRKSGEVYNMNDNQEPVNTQGKIPIALIGAVLLIILAAALLWTQNAQTTQASMAMP